MSRVHPEDRPIIQQEMERARVDRSGYPLLSRITLPLI